MRASLLDWARGAALTTADPVGLHAALAALGRAPHDDHGRRASLAEHQQCQTKMLEGQPVPGQCGHRHRRAAGNWRP